MPANATCCNIFLIYTFIVHCYNDTPLMYNVVEQRKSVAPIFYSADQAPIVGRTAPKSWRSTARTRTSLRSGASGKRGVGALIEKEVRCASGVVPMDDSGRGAACKQCRGKRGNLRNPEVV